MKRVVIVFLVSVMALCIASCGGNSNTNNSSNSDNVSNQEDTSSKNEEVVKTGVASITPLDGWKLLEGSVIPNYQSETIFGASLMLTTDIMPTEVKTADEFVAFAQEKMKKTFPNAVFNATTKSKVGGMDAVEFTWTVDIRGLKMKYRTVYILKDGKAYTITCSSLEQDFDKANVDFQKMIDTYSL